jgi:glycine/D-amino acid oxidase-like deaminating enzyme
MAYTDNFRKQHGELLNVAKSMAKLLDAERLKQDATEVRRLLSVLHGKLSVHLVMEDKSLYPRLLNHHDAEIRATTQRFIDEMGTLAGVFKGYVGKWPTPSAIQADPAAFVAETTAVFEALGGRIRRENEELYVLADEQETAYG